MVKIVLNKKMYKKVIKCRNIEFNAILRRKASNDLLISSRKDIDLQKMTIYNYFKGKI